MNVKKDFIEKLSSIDNEYRPVPFWFINHYIREDLLRRQIREMREKGFGGIMFHGRDGLRSGYLEKEWEDGVTWAIEESEKYGMDVWLYDENHYPSGPAGNIVFRKYPERTMMSLVVVLEETVQPGGDVNFELSDGARLEFALAFTSEGDVEQLDIAQESPLFNWTNTSDREMNLMLLSVNREWPTPGQNFSFYPDYLDPEVSNEFIDLGYKWYTDRFKSKMGTTIKGIFTDNSCFNFGRVRRSVAWTPKLAERFKEETNLELATVLPALFCRIKGFERIRQLFWRFLGDEYLRTFVHPIQNICERNDIAATGHYCIEDGSGEHIRQIGDRFDLKRGQTLPCVDMLGRKIGEDLFKNGHQICASMRGTADAAYYSKGSRVMCECLGLMGGWKLDLGEIKRVTGFLAAQGIDIFVPHGLYYSIAGTRKWECIPDHYHNPMWNYYREWTDWISKISFLMAYSDRTGAVAVLHPSTTLRSYIDLGVEFDSENAFPASDRGAECDLSDNTFRATVNHFVKNNIEFDIIDEHILQHAEVADGKLILTTGNGKKRELSVIVLPACKVLEAKSMATLQHLRKTGGDIITINERVESVYDNEGKSLVAVPDVNALSAGSHFEIDLANRAPLVEVVDLIRQRIPQQVVISSNGADIVSRVWRKWGHCFFMLHNATPETINDVHIQLESDSEPFVLDLNDNSLARIADFSKGEYEFTHTFSPGETLMLVSGDDLNANGYFDRGEMNVETAVPLADDWKFDLLADNVLPLCDGEVRNRDMRQTCVYHFQVRDVPAELKLVIDREMTKSELLCNQYSSNLKCFINGNLVETFAPGTHIDYFMFEAEISEFLKKGDNEISIGYSSSLWEQDRQFHVPFIVGQFQLVAEYDGFAIAAPEENITLGDWGDQGYQFYAGEVSYKQSIVLPEEFRGKRLTLSLGDLSNAVEVLINGQSLGRKVLPPWDFDIPSFSNESEFDLEIRIINTPQNLYCEERMRSGLFGPVEVRVLEK